MTQLTKKRSIEIDDRREMHNDYRPDDKFHLYKGTAIQKKNVYINIKN